MNALLTAIYNRGTDSSDFNTAVGGRLYAFKAPQEATFPYCVFHEISETYDFTMALSNEFEDILIQFNIFSDKNSPSEVGTICGYLKARFDWCALTVSGYTCLKMEREWAHRMYLSEEAIWQYAVQYRCLLEK